MVDVRSVIPVLLTNAIDILVAINCKIESFKSAQATLVPNLPELHVYNLHAGIPYSNGLFD